MSARAKFRAYLRRNPPKLPQRIKLEGKPEVPQWPPPAGWMIPVVLELDDRLWGRWLWWCLEGLHVGRVPKGDIPQIDFEDHPHPLAVKTLHNALDEIQAHGTSRGRATEYLIDWLCYALGLQSELPREPTMQGKHECFRACYSLIDVGFLQTFPYDYVGHLLCEISHGKWQGFYPTPMPVVEAMARMAMHDLDNAKLKTVCDPCVGTGRMLLWASNHSLRLSGQDINETVLKACKINMMLYAPWGAKPLPESAFEGLEHASETVTTPPTQLDLFREPL